MQAGGRVQGRGVEEDRGDEDEEEEEEATDGMERKAVVTQRGRGV